MMERAARSTLSALHAQPDDGWGLLLVVAGVLAALGLLFQALGPAGHWLFRYGSLSFGWGEDVIAPCLLIGGALLIAERSVWGAIGTLGSVAALTLASSGLADLAG
ncbi:MAG: hypothetical protein ACRDZT_01350, partial [Acidimicrobiales bacterium]